MSNKICGCFECEYYLCVIIQITHVVAKDIDEGEGSWRIALSVGEFSGLILHQYMSLETE